MATKARQQYHADEVTLSKDRREFSISDDVQEKIDGIEEGAQVNTIETIRVNGSEVQPDENKAIDLTIPGVIDSLSSTSITDALSARQGKILYDKIDNISRIGHFLALWDASTGLPVTDPETSPYEYHAGDFYIISIIAAEGGTNYKPSGTEYISGQASTAVETDDVEVNDFYFYDGQVWRHMKNSGAGDVVVDGSLSTTSRNPVENRVITNALSGKQNTLTAGANIQINGNTISATDTKYTAGTNVQISNQNVISATDTKYTAGTGINIDANNVISNTQTSAEWGNITGTLSDQTDLQTALNAKQDNMVILKYGTSTWNDFITAYNKNAIVYCRASSNSNPATGSQTRLAFMAYVNNETAPTEVEFQYYRSRSSHSTAATVLDEVYVYKLVSTGGGTWSVTQRDTAAKPLAGTGIGFTYNASGMTISADTTTLATKTDLNSKQDTLVSGTNIKTVNSNSLLGSGNITLNDVKSSATAPSSPTEGMVWYDTTNDQLKVYDGANWVEVGVESNTKTFLLTSDSDKATATEAYKWFSEGNYPIIMRGSATFVGPRLSGNNLVFTQTEPYYNTGNTTTSIQPRTITFMYDTSTEQVTQILYSIGGGIPVLQTNTNYSTPYTPQYDGSPATKKYVDDSVIEYNAGEGIEIGTYNDYSAMRGPCPEGFHVPLITEWQGLETIMRGLSLTTGDGWRINLHIPFAGERSNSSSSVSQQGDGAFYWSSSPCGDEYPYSAWYIYLNSGNVLSDNFYYRPYGSSIRGFKDIYVTPDNTWTVIQGTLGSAGIFWNQSEGLISITNGTTGYTIMDKNLGATTVYNNGDTLTQANMGNMYQWGNNYGFPSTGTITNTSSTQVDASAYGPGNYYNSDTFITRSTSPFDWSSVTNNNLWGGVTGVVTLENVITNTGVLSVNGQAGDVTVEPGITKIFELSSLTDLTTAQAAYDWFAAGKAPIIKYSRHFYTMGSNASTELHFFRLRDFGNVSASYWIYTSSIVFSISSGSVTAVSQKNNYIQLSSSAPSTDDKGIITLVI